MDVQNIHIFKTFVLFNNEKDWKFVSKEWRKQLLRLKCHIKRIEGIPFLFVKILN